ncbi:MAG: M61 family metallopeptidase [Burkholderiales bacterium]|nr:M61 family metallopeptidase [Burkholderiales bacterium]
MTPPAPLHYRIAPSHPGAHLFEVSLTIPAPAPAGQRVALPAWIPGSYMIREFSRNIVRIAATSRGRPVALEKLDKHTWAAAPCDGPLVVTCEIYAWDLSVRAAHLDESHGFFNGTSVFLRALGHEDAPHEVEIVAPRGRAYAGWRVATALPRARGTAAHGFGLYRAAGYDELVDHPVEMGTFSLVGFRACGVAHEVAITGRHDCDLRRLAADLKKICEAQIRFFHGRRAGPAQVPFARYVFQVMAVGDGYGGLEHRASTALICSRNDLPHAGMAGMPEGYRSFLGLCSHEYFHTWNVKRIKPAAFAPYDLTRENYTRLLWAFEGFTSYYDDLFLKRAGLIDEAAYLGLLAKTVQGVLRGAGRLKQSVAESSFDAWTKYYRQDENAPNAIVSYYTKGSLVALCLDLLLRQRTGGARSLDDVMHLLWRDYGASFEQRGAGVPEDGLLRAAIAVAPAHRRALQRFFASAVDGTADLPLKPLLAAFGIDLQVRRGARPALGARTAAAPDGVRLTHVLDGGGAQAAGLSAGDVVIAVDGIKVGNGSLDGLLARRARGATVQVHAFRRDELIVRDVRLGTSETTVEVVPAPRQAAAAQRLRRAWLAA